MKEETIEAWMAVILILVLLFMVFTTIYFVDKNGKERMMCLEPYALEICQERDLYYYSHSTYFVSCKEDVREMDSLRFKFNRTEKSGCGIGGVDLE